jgi:hypothetical protein
MRSRATERVQRLEASSLSCRPQTFHPHPHLSIFIPVHAYKPLISAENALAYFGRFGRFGSFSFRDVTFCKVTDSVAAGVVFRRFAAVSPEFVILSLSKDLSVVRRSPYRAHGSTAGLLYYRAVPRPAPKRFCGNADRPRSSQISEPASVSHYPGRNVTTHWAHLRPILKYKLTLRLR